MQPLFETAQANRSTLVSTTQTNVAQRGDEITLDIEKFADQGKALARLDGLVVFVPQAVPGDRIRAAVYKRTSSYAEAKLIELLEPSAKRTEPRCFYFGTCGGCSWQHVRYDEQARMKAQSVREALLHQGDCTEEELAETFRPILKADQPYFYRGKMSFDFSNARWLTPDEIATGEDFDTAFALGLHVPNNFYKVLDLHECHLQSRLSRRLVNGVRDFVKERGWAPWDIRRHTGFLRHLVIREGKRTGAVMVRLVTGSHDAERMDALAGFIKDTFPEVTTFVHTVNDTPSQADHGGDHRTVFGDGLIREELGGLTFEIGPDTFFQANPEQAERLFEVAREQAGLTADDRLYDLYCGTGALSLFMADAVREVIGIEQHEGAVQAARRNAQANGIDNARFHAGALRDVLTEAFIEAHGRPDVLFADPPRAGMHKRVVDQVAAVRPKRFVYVSCNPQTQARDLKRLRAATEGAYRITAVQPADLFPQTQHVENMVALTLAD